MHSILNKHQIIAWDMDQTLVNGPNSEFFRNYIVRNPEKEHHIVTFRNKDWADMIWDELATFGFNARKHIKAVHNCPEIIHDSFMAKNSKTDLARFLWVRNIEPEQFAKHIEAFPKWKAYQSKKIGATVIVDDLPEFVLPGCLEHDIDFVDALEKIPVTFLRKL